MIAGFRHESAETGARSVGMARFGLFARQIADYVDTAKLQEEQLKLDNYNNSRKNQQAGETVRLYCLQGRLLDNKELTEDPVSTEIIGERLAGLIVVDYPAD